MIKDVLISCNMFSNEGIEHRNATVFKNVISVV